MNEMRSAKISIDADTSLTEADIKDLQGLVFGRLRSDSYAPKHRLTIKRHMPAGLNHDVRGIIRAVSVTFGKLKEAVSDKAKEEAPKRKRAAAKKK